MAAQVKCPKGHWFIPDKTLCCPRCKAQSQVARRKNNFRGRHSCHRASEENGAHLRGNRIAQRFGQEFDPPARKTCPYCSLETPVAFTYCPRCSKPLEMASIELS